MLGIEHMATGVSNQYSNNWATLYNNHRNTEHNLNVPAVFWLVMISMLSGSTYMYIVFYKTDKLLRYV